MNNNSISQGANPDQRQKSQLNRFFEHFKSTEAHYIMIALLVPFIGWAIGALINPEGWMSSPEVITVVPLLLGMYAYVYWPISLALLALLIAVGMTVGKRAVSIIILTIGVLYALFIGHGAATAPPDEFA